MKTINTNHHHNHELKISTIWLSNLKLLLYMDWMLHTQNTLASQHKTFASPAIGTNITTIHFRIPKNILFFYLLLSLLLCHYIVFQGHPFIHSFKNGSYMIINVYKYVTGIVENQTPLPSTPPPPPSLSNVPAIYFAKKIVHFGNLHLKLCYNSLTLLSNTL